MSFPQGQKWTPVKEHTKASQQPFDGMIPADPPGGLGPPLYTVKRQKLYLTAAHNDPDGHCQCSEVSFAINVSSVESRETADALCYKFTPGEMKKCASLRACKHSYDHGHTDHTISLLLTTPLTKHVIEPVDSEKEISHNNTRMIDHELRSDHSDGSITILRDHREAPEQHKDALGAAPSADFLHSSMNSKIHKTHRKSLDHSDASMASVGYCPTHPILNKLLTAESRDRTGKYLVSGNLPKDRQCCEPNVYTNHSVLHMDTTSHMKVVRRIPQHCPNDE